MRIAGALGVLIVGWLLVAGGAVGGVVMLAFAADSGSEPPFRAGLAAVIVTALAVLAPCIALIVGVSRGWLAASFALPICVGVTALFTVILLIGSAFEAG
ncbi:MAG: hypothetical protein AAF907_03540 [Planctomycetota bacterium]